MLWGELAEHLGNDIKAYELTRSQANWLFDNSRYADAAPIFRQTTSSWFHEVQDKDLVRGDKIRLGHCYWRLGNIKQASDVWEQDVALAKQNNDIKGQAYFEYNLGQALSRLGQWDKALTLLESALDHGQVIDDKDLLGEVLFVTARLRAYQGDYLNAIGELRRGMNLVNYTNPNSIRQAQALIYAGDVYRYAEDIEAAKRSYIQADKLLDKLSGGFDWQAQTYAGLGATYNSAGILKRLEGWGDIRDAISDQLEAFKYLNEALNLVREHKLESHLVLVLDRIGEIFFETNELRYYTTLGNTAKALFRRLQNASSNLTFVEEANWLHGLREPETPFTSLDTLGKAQRLFEVAFLQAEKNQSPHQVLDSLVSAARVAQRRNRNADLEYYTTLVDILSGLDDPRQETIFLNLLDVFFAHLTFDDDPEGSLDQYEIAMAKLADFGGFGWLQARKELPEVQKRLVSLAPTSTKESCQRLADAWSNNAELLAFVKGLQDLI